MPIYCILQKNGTWFLSCLPPGKHLVDLSYKVKYHANGSQERYKAHLMAKGYTQQEDIDYLDTFSLVAKLVTVEVFLTLVAIHG